MHSKYFRIYLILFLLMTIQACSAIPPLSPSQTAEQFWGAVLVDNTEAAGRFATAQSATELSSLPEELQNATVSFGAVTISSNEATVETSLQLAAKDVQPDNFKFSTFLQRVDEHWRVDWLETRKSLDESRERGIDKLVRDLEKLGRDLSGQLNEAMKNWEEMEPEIKQNLQELGESIQKDVEGTIDKYGPEIERKLQDLNQSLEEALKELEKAVPQQPEQPQPPQQEQSDGRMI